VLTPRAAHPLSKKGPSPAKYWVAATFFFLSAYLPQSNWQFPIPSALFVCDTYD
jgi:hypothetical protein